ncbi:ATP-grasp domain-containing protein [Alkalibacterium subtropicum]|uniref:ATP-grasp domain-containing protein n=1 Tax=Alkalibacterium subtropicum TaxID=753702 RepID=A0A1I1KHN0_9LACT|nr:ATP-grasp domain-containing protein [Alkalibacterium subtropicum]SFC56930.1 ATP-grasp domain-containing protein [Alkalibacterium subtropicum]
MKKILVLGGAEKMLPLLNYAKEKGYYIILCDYLLDNPGREFADEYFSTSATDKEAILELAREKNIDGIISFSSDIIALTAAYVGNRLNIPSNPYESVLTLSRKDLFRHFLQKNHFNCPKAVSFHSYESAVREIDRFKIPFMVKPVDSAGSSGVVKIEDLKHFKQAFMNAIQISNEKKVIIEEYVEMNHECMIAGDAFVLDGKVEFMGLLNSYRGAIISPYIPTGTSYPVYLDEKQVGEVNETVQRVMDILDIKFGGFNLELMFDKQGELYIIEIGPRNGGNMIPQLLRMATGIDLISTLVETSIGNYDIDLQVKNIAPYCSTYVIHSNRKGKLCNIKYKNGIKDKIVHEFMNLKKGDMVEMFDNSKKAIGIIFLKFNSLKEEKTILNNIEDYLEIELDNQ